MAEWSNAAVLKTVVGRKAHPEFESQSLRLIFPARENQTDTERTLRRDKRPRT